MFGTVTQVTPGGVRLQIDGEQSASQKEYKILQSYRPRVGDRVRVEESGNSLLVTGAIGGVTGGPAQLAANATLAQVIAKINEMINANW